MKIEIGMPCIVFVVFMVLKLCGVIDWSWWEVAALVWSSLWLAVAAKVLWWTYFEE